MTLTPAPPTMDYPLTVPAILRRTLAHFGDKRIITRRAGGALHRTTYEALLARAARLAAALARLGVRPGDAVATLCWNHDRHLEAYYAIPAMGAVLHTLNLRLTPAELGHVVRDAEDRLLFVDAELAPLAREFLAGSAVETVIVVGELADRPHGWRDYEALLAAEPAAPPLGAMELAERAPAAMCHTSGTTGHAKGVVYTHRALALHSLALATADLFGLREADVILPAVAMFHANAWGLPYAAALVGADLVLPGAHLDARGLRALLAEERVTVTAGVPTVWLGLLELLDTEPGATDLGALRLVVVGGAPMPQALLDGLEGRHGLPLHHSWGMTELAPVGTLNRVPTRGVTDRTYRTWAGTPGPFLEIRARGEAGLIPWDGEAVGELEVRGPAVAGSYHGLGAPPASFTPDGWFRTGDVVSIDPHGTLRLRDRAKDLVKSGGEWISSVTLEVALMNHPAVLEAAVVAVPHPKWIERPLAAIVVRPGAAVTDAELAAHLAASCPRWWVPDAFVRLDALPRTSTGKYQKTVLRERFRDHYGAP